MSSDQPVLRPAVTRILRSAGASLLALLLLWTAGCGQDQQPARRTITKAEELSAAARQSPPALSAAERVGLATPAGAAAPGAMAPAMQMPAGGQPSLHWETPEGWQEEAPSAMRTANFTLPSIPGAECYLTVLPGDGGGVLANVNRWRGQMSLPPITQAELDALPRKPMLGGEAAFAVLDGTFGGMRGEQKSENYRMLGAALVQDGSAYFAKLTGPADQVAGEEAHFDAFLASLHVAEDDTAHAAAAPAMPAMPAAPAMDVPPPPPADLTWSAPATWTQAPDRMMRVVTFTVGQSECYVTQLAGDAGGVTMNLNRWRTQMGQPELSAEEIAALPKISMLGAEASMIDITGDFAGMGGTTMTGARLLGAIAMKGSQSVFVKMTGPEAEVNAERENFIAFCQSLK